ncbi:MAG: hypothetical protein UIG59_04355 [Acutalibacteraceae bacterium]|nr:hypothetical protein [Acutalibacteraceae bacterium]
MNKTKKITISAMMAALASVFMLTSYFPYLTYAIPAIAGLFVMVVVIEVDTKWATFAYVVSATIAFLMAEPEAKMLYIMFFGYYPIIKALFERLRSRVFEYVLKFLVFNIAVILAYTLASAIFGITLEDMDDFGKYTAIILLAAGNVVFPIYDVCVSRMAQFYSIRLHPAVSKIFSGKR